MIKTAFHVAKFLRRQTPYQRLRRISAESSSGRHPLFSSGFLRHGCPSEADFNALTGTAGCDNRGKDGEYTVSNLTCSNSGPISIRRLDTVHSWIWSDKRKKPYIAPRIAEKLHTTEINAWRYVPSKPFLVVRAVHFEVAYLSTESCKHTVWQSGDAVPPSKYLCGNRELRNEIERIDQDCTSTFTGSKTK